MMKVVDQHVLLHHDVAFDHVAVVVGGEEGEFLLYRVSGVIPLV